MRGSVIFESLFEPEEDQSETPPRGRNPELIARRNELILHRYWFFGAYTQIRHSAVIKALSDEFFLTDRRVQDIIFASGEQLKAMRASPPKLDELRARWPHLSWRA